MALSVPFWLEGRLRAKEAKELSDQARLLAARIREEAKEAAVERGDDEDPEMIFHVVRGEDLIEVEIFLDEKMLGELNHGEKSAWQGLIEFIEDDVDQLP